MPAPRFDTTYRALPPRFYAPVDLVAVPAPKLVRLNEPLAADLGLDVDWLTSPAGVEMLAGMRMPENVAPLAMVYAGHQFGGWAPRLGDGRAMLVGELVAANGIRFDLHLKGSGPTPFSRRGDGKAGLGPVLREYIVSEAMHALGVPTTRTLAAVTTGEPVVRQRVEPGAVLARVARSHVRVGTFQYFYGQDDRDGVERLADYVIARHYPDEADTPMPHRGLWTRVMERQAELVAHWMSLGFIHGVMNTDNTQVVGETIDYGPCAFMDDFHPEKVFSSIDHGGRYAWSRQPSIALWNLLRLAETLLPGLGEDEARAIAWVEAQVETFERHFDLAFGRRMRDKLGLGTARPSSRIDALVSATLSAMTEGQVDFTLFFRRLTRAAAGAVPVEEVTALFSDPARGASWWEQWRATLDTEGIALPTAAATMRGVNPIFIPRNHRVEEALGAATGGNLAPFERLLKVLTRPFDEQPEHAELERSPRPDEIVHQTFCGT
ncbi:MAG: YdiU family protein [Myxococcota bacterium]